MAELFLARDPGSPGFKVIKRILPHLSQEAEFVQMFLDEARIAAQLHHENVIQLFELGKLEDSIFIAMEFVDGVDLRNLLQAELKRKGTVPYGIAAWIAARICDGLHYAHNGVGLDGRPLELIHRDISPQNVMVGFDGRVKLVDFGIAKAGAFMERSKPGVIKGKFLYLSPEQLTHDPIDRRADLFALGTMLYEVTTGKSPFYKLTTEAVILAIRNEDPPPPHLVVPNYPVDLSRIVMRCLAKDRTRRYQQAAEIAEDLNRFLSGHAPTTSNDVARYVNRLFGEEAERTVMNVPGLESLREELAAAAPPARPSPPPLPPPVEDAPEDVTRTEMARPVDLRAILGRPAPRPSTGEPLEEPSSTLSASSLPTASERIRSRRNARVEEEASTMDYGTFVDAKPPLLTPGRIIVAAVGTAVLLILGAAILRATRSPDPVEALDEGEGPEAELTEVAEPPELSDGPTAHPARVRVLFKAQKGTQISSGETRFIPGRVYDVEPGTLPVSWRCPSGRTGSFAFNIEEGRRSTHQLSISCRRK